MLEDFCRLRAPGKVSRLYERRMRTILERWVKPNTQLQRGEVVRPSELSTPELAKQGGYQLLYYALRWLASRQDVKRPAVP